MTRNLFLAITLLLSIQCPGQAFWTNYNTTNSGLLSNDLQCLVFNESNTLWAAYTGVGGTGLGVVKFDGTTWTNYNTSNSGLPNNDIRAIASDYAGNMWFGCYNGGLTKYNSNTDTWTFYNTSNSGLPHDGVSSLICDNNGHLWVGMYFGGVSKFDGTTWTHYDNTNAPFPATNCVNDILVDDDFNLWVGFDCQGGLARKDPSGVWTSYTTENSDIPHHTVTAISPTGDGKVWVGYTTNVISSFNGTEWTNYDLPATVSTSYHGFEMDYSGQMWCGSQNAGLLKFTGSEWVTENVPGSGNTNSLFRASVGIDQNHDVWWGEMYNGLWKRSSEDLIWIADANLRNCLKDSYPSAFDANNFLIAAQAKTITEINCTGKGIQSLAGIEAFENVTKLFLSNNALITINEISSLTKVVTLNLFQNAIIVVPDLSQLHDLEFVGFSLNKISQFPDLTNNLKIKWLYFSYNKLTTVSNLSHLTDLELLAVNYNPVTTLPSFDLNAELKQLNFQQTKVTAFPDLSNNLKLESLHFGKNPQFSTWPQITANVKLQYLGYEGNNLSTIPDLSIYPELKTLICAGNNLNVLPDLSMLNNLNYLDAANNNLTSLPDLSHTLLGVSGSQLYISGNHLTFEDLIPLVTLPGYSVLSYAPQALTPQDLIVNKTVGETFSLDIQVDHGMSGNTYKWFKDDAFFIETTSDNLTIQDLKITDSGKYRCEITNPQAPDLTIAWKEVTLTVSESTGLIWIADANLRNCLKESHPSAFDANGFLIAAQAKNITEINCTGKGIQSLAGIEAFENVTSLILFNNALTTINEISSLTKIVTLHLFQNAITVVPDLSQLPDLEFVGFSLNNISQFPDLTNNLKVKSLYFTSNNLTTISGLSHLTDLELLAVNYNPVTTLPSFKLNTELKHLVFEKTQITSFPDLSANLKLESLNFGKNPQFSTWPEITANVNLQSIGCEENNLSTIPDLSIYPGLKSFGCSGNNLSVLPDLSMFNELNYLDAADNNLTSLPDLSHTLLGSASSQLYISGNHLTFEDLIPLVTLPGYGVLSYEPQTLTPQDLVVNKTVGEIFSLDIEVDHGVSGNTYKWFKDNAFFIETTSDNLTIQDLKTTDSGKYRCEITNPLAPDLTIAWQEVTLTVSESSGLIWIADANLRNCLKDSYPSAFDANNFLIVAQAKTITEINCSGKGIQSLAGIEAFENVTTLFLYNNVLTTINEISSLTKVATLHLSQNAITVVPDLSQLHNLEFAGFSSNKISQFPDLTNNLKIKSLLFSYNNLTGVSDLSHLTDLELLAVNHNPVATLPSFKSNTELKQLNFQKTQVTIFPDLSDNLKLESLHFGKNPQFSTWPQITANVNLQYIGCEENKLSTIPDLNIYPGLKSLTCSGNNLAVLPDLSTLNSLNYLDAASNYLTSLPDLNHTLIGSDGSQLYLSGNHLTFEDLIPLVTLPGYAVLTYEPQTTVHENITIDKYIGDTLSLDIQVDHSISGNTYNWFKNNGSFLTTNTDNLTIKNLTDSDAGIYHCEITNPLAPDLKLVWRSATLTVSDPCAMFTADDFTAQITFATCISGGKILIKESGSPAVSVEEFILEEINSGNKISSAHPEIAELPVGAYRLYLKKGTCSVEWTGTLEIAQDHNCNNPVISPNNDGQSEDFYIPFQGTIKIYNKDGQIVKEFSAPSAWDGTDNSGNPVPMGLYIITSDGQKEIAITVVR
jgi:Leucine-rich repeat (LRR) protein